MTNRLEKENIEASRRQVLDYATQTAEEDRRELGEQEIEIINKLVDIIYNTEVPKFEVIEVGSVKNEVIQKKFAKLSENKSINDKLIPSQLTKDFPVDFSDPSNLEKAPWVNMVHAWTLVLNWMNSINGMQEENQFNPEDIVTIARKYLKFTTESDNDLKRLRSSADFLSGSEFEESRHRRRGTKNVNALRYVCQAEMMYILDTIQKAYAR